MLAQMDAIRALQLIALNGDIFAAQQHHQLLT